MIFIYKRVVLNNLEHFLDWFKSEIEDNQRFRDVYLIVCANNMQFVVQQWAVMLGGLLGSDEGDKIDKATISNKIEMLFE